MPPRNLEAALEALLFSSDQPLSLALLGESLEAPLDEVAHALKTLEAGYASRQAGVELREIAGGYLLVTAAEHAEWVGRLLRGKKKMRLSRAALETMAIIAYKQPVTKSEVEAIRGVDSSAVLGTLPTAGADDGRRHPAQQAARVARPGLATCLRRSDRGRLGARERHRGARARHPGRARSRPRRGPRAGDSRAERAAALRAPQAGRRAHDPGRPAGASHGARIVPAGRALVPGGPARCRHQRPAGDHERRRAGSSSDAPALRRGETLSRPRGRGSRRDAAQAAARGSRARAWRDERIVRGAPARGARRARDPGHRGARGAQSSGAAHVRGGGPTGAHPASLGLRPAAPG